MNWTETPPEKSGYYWYRAHGGHPNIGYWNHLIEGFFRIAAESALWADPDGVDEIGIAENGIEFWPVPLTFPPVTPHEPPTSEPGGSA